MIKRIRKTPGAGKKLNKCIRVPKNIEGLRQDAGCYVSFTYHLLSAAKKVVKSSGKTNSN